MPRRQTPDDQLFMAFCKLEARKSDETTKIGSCVVGRNGKVVGLGWNTVPVEEINEPHPLDDKFFNAGHAEVTAIIKGRKVGSLKGGTIYSTRFPCSQCAKLIIDNGIKEVICLNYQPSSKSVYTEMKDIKAMFVAASVEYRRGSSVCRDW